MVAADLITNALRSIGAVASGEQPPIEAQNEALIMLNDMVDQWSNSHQMIFNVNEIVFNVISPTFVYTIGPGGTANFTFTGSIATTVLTATVVPSPGVLDVGLTLAGTGITPGTTIIDNGTSTGGVGTYMVYPSQTAASTTITATFQKPLRINSGYVRVSTLDYPLSIVGADDYALIGLKTLNGAWARTLWYNPGSTVGTATFWPVGTGEIHLLADQLFSGFNTLQDTVTLPQGYKMALRWNLAEMLMPEYGTASQTQIAMVTNQAQSSRAWVKRTNMNPIEMVHFDDALGSRRSRDASFILHGGFN